MRDSATKKYFVLFDIDVFDTYIEDIKRWHKELEAVTGIFFATRK